MEAARTRIALLMAWRRGACAAALACVGFLAAGLLGSAGPLVGFGSAICVIGGVEAALRRFLRESTLHPELAEIPAVAQYRDRLCSPRNRRRLATWLRRTARDSLAARASPYVLWDRVALVRDELLALADELDSAETVDPRTMIEIKELLCSGRDSPLLNADLPVAGAVSAVRCARFRVITAPLHESIGRSVASVAPFPATDSDQWTSRTRSSEHAENKGLERRIRQRDR